MNINAELIKLSQKTTHLEFKTGSLGESLVYWNGLCFGCARSGKKEDALASGIDYLIQLAKLDHGVYQAEAMR
jgi:hypothetical protein